jgi:hypothetical protein
MPTERLPVVFVAGSGHTGSTLLALVLDSHPEIACVGESSIKPQIVRRGAALQQPCSCGALIPECPFWQAVFKHVTDQGHDFGPAKWTGDYRFTNRVAQRLLSRACGSKPGRALVRWSADHLPVYSRRIHEADAVNVAFIRAVLDVSGARVFADTSKRMWRLVHLMRLSELDLKLVLLVRDVRGYAASAKRRWGVPVRDSARTWLRDQQSIMEVASRFEPSRVLRLRYEDLCGRTEAAQRDLWAFCGVTCAPTQLTIDATRHHVLGNAMRLGGEKPIRLDDRWRETLDASEIAGALAVAGSLNGALGYE